MGQEMGVLPSDLLKMVSIISEAATELGCSTSDVVAMVENADRAPRDGVTVPILGRGSDWIRLPRLAG